METCNPKKRSNTHASRKRGCKSADAATATHIPAPKTRDIGYNAPFPVMMGHGFNNFRGSNYIDLAVVPILEAYFQMGVENYSNRKGLLEMEKECEKKLTPLLVPDRHAITAWLYSLLEIIIIIIQAAAEQIRQSETR